MSYSTFPTSQAHDHHHHHHDHYNPPPPVYSADTQPLLAEPAYAGQPSAATYGGSYGAAYAIPSATASYPSSGGYPSVPASSAAHYHQPSIPVEVCQPSSTSIISGCPRCHSSALETEFTCCGILCAILLFPIGLVCCLMMTRKRCINCGAVFE